jgi:hypothetical protein
MPSLTASARPQQAIKIRSGPAGSRRTSAGPIQPPIRKPAASGRTASQRTGPKIANPMLATALASPATAFLMALETARGSASILIRTARSRMPPAAPK